MSTEINLDDYHVREISEQIREKQVEYWHEEDRLTTLRQRLESIETELGAQIATEKVGDKPRFTNDVTRKAEAIERLSLNGVYRTLAATIRDAELQQHIREVEVEKLLRDYDIEMLAFEAISIGRRK